MNFKLKCFSLIFFCLTAFEITIAQSGLDIKGQNDYKAILYKYQQNDYKLQSQKELTLSSGKILTLSAPFSPDYDYIIGLVCSGTTNATGVELRDDFGNQLTYEISYDQFGKNVTLIQFSSDRQRTCRVLLNAIDKSHLNVSSQFFILVKEKDKEKEKKIKILVQH